jgi:hypothetical protein
MTESTVGKGQVLLHVSVNRQVVLPDGDFWDSRLRMANSIVISASRFATAEVRRNSLWRKHTQLLDSH